MRCRRGPGNDLNSADLMPRVWQGTASLPARLIEPTGALHQPRLLCLGILHGPILCLGILLGPDLYSYIFHNFCSGIFHDLCSLHGPDLLLLVRAGSVLGAVWHDLCLGIL